MEGSGVVAHAEVVTLSKAAGAVGGFVVADRDTAQLLKTRARSFVYSTASPAAVCAAGAAAIDLMEKADDRREKLRANAQYLRGRLNLPGETPIIPLVPGSTEAALRVMRAARRRGALIRPLGNVVVVMPPPAISTRDLGRLIEIVKASIATA